MGLFQHAFAVARCRFTTHHQATTRWTTPPRVRVAEQRVGSTDLLEPRTLLAAPVLAFGTLTHVEGMTVEGESLGDGFGSYVSDAGDVNNDGFDDFFVGAPNHDENDSNAGAAYIVSGFNGSIISEFNGQRRNERFGTAVDGAGDVNDDGFEDVIVGASSVVRVLSGENGRVLHTFQPATGGTYFGIEVAGVGDVDLDGYPDILVGARNDNLNGNGSGAVYVYSGLTGQQLYAIGGDKPGDYFGEAVSAAGDVNNDGYADLYVGNDDFRQNGARLGLARVISGKDGSRLYSFHGDNSGDHFGHAVADAGDVNNDGFSDLIVGARWDDNNGIDSGSARVFSGKDGRILYNLDGDSARDDFGFSVTGVKDLNGDGHDDFAVGAFRDDNRGSSSGSVRVTNGFDGSTLFEFNGEAAGGQFGFDVSNAGDLNNDRVPDFIVGAPGAGNGGRVRTFVSTTLNDPAIVYEGIGALIIPFANSLLTDVDDTMMSRVVIKMTRNFEPGLDRLTLERMLPAGIQSSGFDATTGTLTFSGVASIADYQFALESLSYFYGGPDTGELKTFSVTITDANGQGRSSGPESTTATRDLRFLRNPAPALTNVPVRQVIDHDGQFRRVTSTVVVDDVDSAHYDGGLFRAVAFASTRQPGDEIRLKLGDGVTASSSSLRVGGSVFVEGVSIGVIERNDSNRFDLRLNANATPESVNAVAKRFELKATQAGAPRIVRLLVEEADGKRGSIDTRVRTSIPVNNRSKPVFESFEPRTLAPADSGFVSVAPNVSITDTDSLSYGGGIFRAIIEIDTFQAGDELRLRSGNGVSISAQEEGGIVRVDGILVGRVERRDDRRLDVRLDRKATPELVSRVAQQIHFSTTAEGADREVRLFLIDGEGLHGVADVFVDTTRPQPPMIGNVPTSVTVNVGGGLVAVAPNATVTDSDSPNFEGGLLRAILHFPASRPGDRLVLQDSARVNVLTAAVGGEIVVDGVVVGVIETIHERRIDVRLNDQATPATTTELLRQIMVSADQSGPDRNIRFVLKEADGMSTTIDVAMATIVLPPAASASGLGAIDSEHTQTFTSEQVSGQTVGESLQRFDEEDESPAFAPVDWTSVVTRERLDDLLAERLPANED